MNGNKGCDDQPDWANVFNSIFSTTNGASHKHISFRIFDSLLSQESPASRSYYDLQNTRCMVYGPREIGGQWSISSVFTALVRHAARKSESCEIREIRRLRFSRSFNVNWGTLVLLRTRRMDAALNGNGLLRVRVPLIDINSQRIGLFGSNAADGFVSWNLWIASIELRWVWRNFYCFQVCVLCIDNRHLLSIISVLLIWMKPIHGKPKVLFICFYKG